MAKLSVIILAKNEEEFIGACLESVKDFADEIIVVDDFSTDNTGGVAKEYGARVIHRALNGNFGAQQTFGIEQATCDWVFLIDADERATPELGNAIAEIVAQDDKTYAYRVARLSYFWGQPIKHGGWFPDYVTRLMPKEGTKSIGDIHQKISHSCRERKISKSKYLVHYPYRDWEHYFNKFNFYTTLMAKKMHAAGKKANVLDMMIRPAWSAFRMYILRGGFLDGINGIALAGFHFAYTLAKYVKLYYFDKKNIHVTEKNVS